MTSFLLASLLYSASRCVLVLLLAERCLYSNGAFEHTGRALLRRDLLALCALAYFGKARNVEENEQSLFANFCGMLNKL
jgi:hypothetical protein